MQLREPVLLESSVAVVSAEALPERRITAGTHEDRLRSPPVRPRVAVATVSMHRMHPFGRSRTMAAAAGGSDRLGKTAVFR